MELSVSAILFTEYNGCFLDQRMENVGLGCANESLRSRVSGDVHFQLAPHARSSENS